MAGVSLIRRLNTFDVTNLVVGSIIGADIYVAAGLGARLLGPASLLIWLVSGLIAIVIALSFSYCAAIMPRVGGPYAYAKTVLGPFAGFIVGWSLLLAEWFSLAVFPVAFVQYFLSFMPNLSPASQIVLKAVFIAIVLAVNLFGVKFAGRFNDALTIGKLSPLLILMGAGLIFMAVQPQVALGRFQPFVTGDLRNTGQALVLIFWAYAGFELSTLPADEIQEPRRTIPKAIAIGMLIVTAFYLTTNFVIVGAVDQQMLSSSPTPLTAAAANIFSLTPALSVIGSAAVGIGALISIMGADESGTIGTSRLAFAMSVDGLLPHEFSKLHGRFRTPYVGLILICSSAFFASVLGGLSVLINSSVFLLSIAYLSTAVSAIMLGRKHDAGTKSQRHMIVSLLAVAFSVLLMTQVNVWQILVSLGLLAVGVPVYVFFSPKSEMHELKEMLLSREAILRRAYRQGNVFLAYALRRVKWLIYRTKGTQRAWKVQDET